MVPVIAYPLGSGPGSSKTMQMRAEDLIFLGQLTLKAYIQIPDHHPEGGGRERAYKRIKLCPELQSGLCRLSVISLRGGVDSE